MSGSTHQPEVDPRSKQVFTLLWDADVSKIRQLHDDRVTSTFVYELAESCEAAKDFPSIYASALEVKHLILSALFSSCGDKMESYHPDLAAQVKGFVEGNLSALEQDIEFLRGKGFAPVPHLTSAAKEALAQLDQTAPTDYIEELSYLFVVHGMSLGKAQIFGKLQEMLPEDAVARGALSYYQSGTSHGTLDSMGAVMGRLKAIQVEMADLGILTDADIHRRIAEAGERCLTCFAEVNEAVSKAFDSEHVPAQLRDKYLAFDAGRWGTAANG